MRRTGCLSLEPWMLAKNIANRPSTTMTMKIDLTTEPVTWRPSDSAEPWTLKTFHGGNEADRPEP